MRLLLSLLLIFLCLFSSAQKTNPNYDSTMAKKFGADDYGMKNYVFVLLKSGTNTTAGKAATDSAFGGHMQNMDRLVKSGHLVVAGPFGKNNDSLRGIFILNVATVEEANVLLQTDPAIKGSFLKAEVYPWYGSAALPAYLEASEKVWKKGF